MRHCAAGAVIFVGLWGCGDWDRPVMGRTPLDGSSEGAPDRMIVDGRPDGPPGAPDSPVDIAGSGEGDANQAEGRDADGDAEATADSRGGGDAGAVDAPSPACSLLKQDCRFFRGCYPHENMPGVTECREPGGTAEGGPCGTNGECERAFTCLETLCARLCDTRSSTPCPGGARCRPLFGHAPAGTCEP